MCTICWDELCASRCYGVCQQSMASLLSRGMASQQQDVQVAGHDLSASRRRTCCHSRQRCASSAACLGSWPQPVSAHSPKSCRSNAASMAPGALAPGFTPAPPNWIASGLHLRPLMLTSSLTPGRLPRCQVSRTCGRRCALQRPASGCGSCKVLLPRPSALQIISRPGCGSCTVAKHGRHIACTELVDLAARQHDRALEGAQDSV